MPYNCAVPPSCSTTEFCKSSKRLITVSLVILRHSPLYMPQCSLGRSQSTSESLESNTPVVALLTQTLSHMRSLVCGLFDLKLVVALFLTLYGFRGRRANRNVALLGPLRRKGEVLCRIRRTLCRFRLQLKLMVDLWVFDGLRRTKGSTVCFSRIIGSHLVRELVVSPRAGLCGKAFGTGASALVVSTNMH